VSSTGSKRASVLLTGADDRSMLAAVRSLSRRDVSFAVLGPGRRSMVGSSRYVRDRLLEPAPSSKLEPDAYVDYILDAVDRLGVELVFPLTDSSLYACDEHRSAIESKARLAAPPSAAVRNVLDKRANLETARRLEIPCPAQFELESIDELPELIAALGFPLVLKNPDRPKGRLGSAFDFRWFVAHDEAELRAFLAEHCAAGEFPLFQTLATGTVHNVCCFGVAGEMVAAHQYRGLRRVHGLTVFREITPLARDLEKYSRSMLRELEWDGVAILGFFVKETDGDVRYMETNARLWASTEGSVAAGWDFPYWMYEYFAFAKPPEAPPRSLGLGRLSRWHYGELDALLHFLSGGEEPSGAGRTRTQAVADYMSGFHPRVDADVFRLDDPVPELVEHWRGIKSYARRALGRLGRGLTAERPARRSTQSALAGPKSETTHAESS
jgi:predicted ATP-grasp superfamily ATP-dependent carboligase